MIKQLDSVEFLKIYGIQLSCCTGNGQLNGYEKTAIRNEFLPGLYLVSLIMHGRSLGRNDASASALGRRDCHAQE